MLNNIRKTDGIVPLQTLEGLLDIIPLESVSRLVKCDLVDKYIFFSSLNTPSSAENYTTHNLTVSRKVKVADYEMEDIALNRAFCIRNDVSSTLQGVICNLYYLSMVCDVYTLLYSNGYISVEDYIDKCNKVKSGILNTFYFVKKTEDKQVEQFYKDYMDYLSTVVEYVI